MNRTIVLPNSALALVYLYVGNLYVKSKAFDVNRVSRISATLCTRSFDHTFSITKSVGSYQSLLSEYNKGEFTQEAFKHVNEYIQAFRTAPAPFPLDHVFKNPPRKYQLDAIDKAWHRRSFALFMQMRTGKTYVTINIATARYTTGKINALLVMCPSSAKNVWQTELEKHSGVSYSAHVVEAGKHKKALEFIQKTAKFKVLIVALEAIPSLNAYNVALEFCDDHRTMTVVDESIYIKNPASIRAKRASILSSKSECRLILNGTPISQGIEDLWSQFNFLNWKIIGEKSYLNFKARYCISGGFQGKSIVGYQNLNILMPRVSPFTYIISTKDAIGLPKVVRKTLVVEATHLQKKALNELGKVKLNDVANFFNPTLAKTTFNGETLIVESAQERLIRYQQIVGGHFPYDIAGSFREHGIKPFTGKNPKLVETLAQIGLLCPNEKVIIWARFKPELILLEKAIKKEYGNNTVVTYKGGMKTKERADTLAVFANDPKVRFIVCNQASGGRAIDLAAASTHIYFSNTFSLDDREQSEMRTNSSLQKAKSILIIDIVVNHAIDKAIVKALTTKKEKSDFLIENLTQRQKNER